LVEETGVPGENHWRHVDRIFLICGRNGNSSIF
jgi:hypothetical protein